jgi:hypothetical protein
MGAVKREGTSTTSTPSIGSIGSTDTVMVTAELSSSAAAATTSVVVAAAAAAVVWAVELGVDVGNGGAVGCRGGLLSEPPATALDHRLCPHDRAGRRLVERAE